MTIQQLTLNGFRSIRNVQLTLGRVNVISGPNGCGKSNLYKAVRLIHEAASGRLSLALAEEGAYKMRCGRVEHAWAINAAIPNG